MSPWLWPSALILALIVIGFGGAYTRVLGPGPGFYVFGVGVLVAFLSSAIFGGAAAFASATGKAWRSSAVKAAVVPLLVAVPLVFSATRGDPPPTMNDITTDLVTPPQFAIDVASGVSAAGGPSNERPEEFSAMQEVGYPDLTAMIVPEAPAIAFARATEVAESFEDWNVVRVDESALELQATAETDLFHFVDDIVIRVRPEGKGARIDMRSRSRVGRGDMGANAARIRLFQEAFGEG